MALTAGRSPGSPPVTTDGEVEVDALWPVPLRAARGWRLRIAGGRVVEATPTAGRAGRLVVGLAPLINGHDHGRGLGTVADGVRDAPLDEWIAAFRAGAEPDSQASRVAVAIARMAASGVGGVVICVNPTTADVAGEVRHAVEAARRTGIRAAIAYPLSAAGGYRSDRARLPGRRVAAEAALDIVDALADELAGDAVDIQYHPVGPQWVDEEMLDAVGQRSAVTGRGVHMHLLETGAQRAWADGTYPDGLLGSLDEQGLLGARTWVAHGTHLRPEEADLLAERKTGVAVNVSSNLRLSSGLPPLDTLVASGVALGVGLDGMTLDDDLDGWSELRLLRGLLQAQRMASVPAAEVLAAATNPAPLGAAGPAEPRPLAATGAGPGEPPARVDLAVHDLSHLAHLAGRPEWPVEEIALAACGAATCTELWSAGRRVHRAPAGAR